MSVSIQAGVIIGLLLLLGLVLAWMGLRRLLASQLLAGGVTILAGAALMALAFLSFGVATNLSTYQQLTAEQPVGELRFEQSAPQDFIVTLTTPTTEYRFNLLGDECQLDARLLKWRGIGQMLGLKTAYRLERLSGRYSDIQQQQQAITHSVHGLAVETGLDLWSMVRQFDGWISWVDAFYGNAVYLPMADGAHYRISINSNGLLVRGANQTADQAIQQW